MNMLNNLRGCHFLCRPWRGASQVESPHLNWATQFLMVAYDGACSSNVSLRMAWNSFGAMPCKKKKLDGSSRLNVVEIAHVTWHAFFQPLLQGKTCNSAHEQSPLSNDTIDSALRHREVGRAKDLSAHPRISLFLNGGVKKDGRAMPVDTRVPNMFSLGLNYSRTPWKDFPRWCKKILLLHSRRILIRIACSIMTRLIM